MQLNVRQTEDMVVMACTHWQQGVPAQPSSNCITCWHTFVTDAGVPATVLLADTSVTACSATLPFFPFSVCKQQVGSGSANGAALIVQCNRVFG